MSGRTRLLKPSRLRFNEVRENAVDKWSAFYRSRLKGQGTPPALIKKNKLLLVNPLRALDSDLRGTEAKGKDA